MGEENRWIDAVPKDISAMWNSNASPGIWTRAAGSISYDDNSLILVKVSLVLVIYPGKEK